MEYNNNNKRKLAEEILQKYQSDKEMIDVLKEAIDYYTKQEQEIINHKHTLNHTKEYLIKLDEQLKNNKNEILKIMNSLENIESKYKKLDICINRLEEKCKVIIELRFGSNAHTLVEIGEKIHLSKATVKRYLDSVIDKTITLYDL